MGLHFRPYFLVYLFQDQRQVEHEMNKILCSHYLICTLLPVLKEINQEQKIELEREAKIKGIQYFM